MTVEGIADQFLHPLWCETNFACFKTVLLSTMYNYVLADDTKSFALGYMVWLHLRAC